MIDYLVEVVDSRPEGRQLHCGVAAAARVLSHVEWHIERTEPVEEQSADAADRKTLDELKAMRDEAQRRIDEGQH